MTTSQVTKIIDLIQEISLSDAILLASQLEKTFGVDTVNSSKLESVELKQIDLNPENKETKAGFNVILQEVPVDKKIAVIKIVKNHTGLSLKESKDLVEGLPKQISRGLKKSEADEIKRELEAAGAKIIID